jgi:hypothetical protein
LTSQRAPSLRDTSELWQATSASSTAIRTPRN